jgi:hypothetical protein
MGCWIGKKEERVCSERECKRDKGGRERDRGDWEYD